jgi:SAM-dependent methyltransferase
MNVFQTTLPTAASIQFGASFAPIKPSPNFYHVLHTQEPDTRSIAERRLQDFKHIFESPTLTAKFNEFLNTIFLQLNEQKFGALMTDILSKNLSYEATYQELFERIGEAKGGPLARVCAQLRSLKVLKETLGSQIQALLCPGAKAKGYAEIGYTGRLIHPIKSKIDLQGRKIVVNEAEKLTDYIEIGALRRPYDQFVKLNYAPLNEKIDQSLDLVVCPIGLHHIPEEQLPSFVKSINKILRPGGSFILRDHDARNRDLEAIASVVHSVFNAATGETLTAEMGEERNFRSLNHWVNLLENNGFQLESTPQLTEGDPTENALMRFRKKSQVPSLSAFERDLNMSQAGYERGQERTYLTTLEWHLVATAKEYADFIKTNAVHQFPFFKHIKVLWNVFFDSSREAIKASGFKHAVQSEGMLMSLFMVMTTSIELAFRGMAFAPLALVSGKKAKAGVHERLAHVSNDYAEFIKTVPFYEFPFFQKMRQMWRGMQEGGNPLLNFYMAAMTTVEFIAKGVFSMPLNATYKDSETGRIQLIVKDPYHKVEQLKDDRIKMVKQDDTGQLKAIDVPRYLQFKEILSKLSQANIAIASIAGQKKIQLKVKVNASSTTHVKYCQKLSEVPILTESTHKYVRLNVDVSKLSCVIRNLEEQGAEISYAHDF